jgi:hypothetical protein
MKNSLILGLTLLCFGICLQGSAQQKQRLSRTELQAKQARLPHKRPAKTKAEIDAMVAKQRMEARESQQKHERMKAAMQQRERSSGNRE